MALSDLSLIEREIIGAFFDAVEAFDQQNPMMTCWSNSGGDEPDVIGGFDRRIFEENMGISDETIVCISNGVIWGSVYFVHGNDEDVICNIGGTEAGMLMMEDLLKGAKEKAGYSL